MTTTVMIATQGNKEVSIDIGLVPEREAFPDVLRDMAQNLSHYGQRTKRGALLKAAEELEQLRLVAGAAAAYYLHYMQDEAESADDCVCGEEQHQRAAAVRDALRALRVLKA